MSTARPLPELDVERVRRYCAERVPPHLHEQVRIEVEVAPGHLTIVESHAPGTGFGPEWISVPVARLRYTKAWREWTLYYPDRNSKSHLYDLVPPAASVERLLAEIEADPTCIFWG